MEVVEAAAVDTTVPSCHCYQSSPGGSAVDGFHHCRCHCRCPASLMGKSRGGVPYGTSSVGRRVCQAGSLLHRSWAVSGALGEGVGKKRVQRGRKRRNRRKQRGETSLKAV